MKTTKRKIALVLSAALAAMLAGGAAFSAPPPGKGPPGGGETAQGNNLSFPALAVDGYTISPISGSQWTVQYTGPYTGLTAAEIALLEASGPWYAQKTEGNTWQADYLTNQTVNVTYVDWGDIIESNNPKVGRPFRLEVQLYKLLNPWEEFQPGVNSMTGYVMAMLANPSSPDEVQGNNKLTYEGNLATVVSNLWKLRIQYCGTAIPAEIAGLYWDGSAWVGGSTTCTDVPITFAVEMNVGGKLIFGASSGGWKPKNAGWYRITFYGPPTTNLSLVGAVVADYDDFDAPPVVEPVLAAEADEGGAATPVVDDSNNISYVDVLAVAGGGGGGGKGKPTN